MLRILVVDDVETTRILMRHIFGSAPDMQVIGEAHDGQQAVTMTRSLRPDIILMDITMPHMDGLEATRQIMADTPTPIVMVSASIEGRENETAFRAMKLGALSLLSKPVGPSDPAFDTQAANLVRTVRTLSSVQVIRHRRNQGLANRRLQNIVRITPGQHDLIAIGASTGGPVALGEIIRGLAPGFNLPIVIAQHIAQEFVPSLIHWLSSLTKLNVIEAVQGESPQPGNIYISPSNCSLTFDIQGRFLMDYQTPTAFKPSVDLLFESTAAVFGNRAIGIILTGMGADGSKGLLKMAQCGAVTIAQDEASCAVFGMPKEAIANGAAKQITALKNIANLLNTSLQPEELIDG